MEDKWRTVFLVVKIPLVLKNMKQFYKTQFKNQKPFPCRKKEVKSLTADKKARDKFVTGTLYSSMVYLLSQYFVITIIVFEFTK